MEHVQGTAPQGDNGIALVMGFALDAGIGLSLIHILVVAKCGVGKVNAAICAQTMLLTYHPELVMNSGVAGSLSEKLRICDVAVGQDIVQHDIETNACGDELALVPELDLSLIHI